MNRAVTLERPTTGTLDLSGAKLWAPARPFDGSYLGMCPVRNAATLLNDEAAVLWELLRATADWDAVVARYARLCPDRAHQAGADLADCVAVWQQAGLFVQPRLRGDLAAAALDGCEWDLDSTLSVAGHSVRLRVADGALSAALRDMLAGFGHAQAAPGVDIAITGSDRAGWNLATDGIVTAAGPSRASMRGAVVSTLIDIAGGARGWLGLLHGACLTNGHRTVMLSAPCGGGKSTLAALLVARGWRLVSDDMVTMRHDLSVPPLPFALSAKSGSWPVLQPLFPGLATARRHNLDGRDLAYVPIEPTQRAHTPVTPDLMLFPSFHPGAMAEAHALRPLDRLMALMNPESWMDLSERGADRLLAWVEATPAYALSYGCSESALPLVDACLSRSKAAPA